MNRSQLILTATTFYYLLLLLTLFSCSNNDTSSHGNTQLIPFREGTMWVYEDVDTGINDYIQSNNTTVTIVDSYTRNDSTYWEINDPYSRFLTLVAIPNPKFVTRGDTIFRQLYTADNSGKKYSYLVKEYVPAPAAGSFTYSDRTVKRLTSPVITPAGTFNSCYQYTYNRPNERVEEIVCPGIGVVKMIEQGNNPNDQWQHVRTLLRYKIIRL